MTVRRSGNARRGRLILWVIVFADLRRAVFIGPAIYNRLEIKVTVARRAGRLPFQRVGSPGISTRGRPEEYAVEEIDDERNLAGHQCDRADGDELIERLQVGERFVVVWVSQPPREAFHPQDVHREEHEVQ